jgi:triosephosphate isomerase
MTKLIAGNWKMFKGPAETLAFFDGFEAPDGVDVILCPPYLSLEAAVGEEWPIYAQNVHWADEGAFTGEISARMLLEIGVEGALVAIPSGASTLARPTRPCGCGPRRRSRPASA